MVTRYITQRRRNTVQSSDATARHHAGWGVVCIILTVVVSGLWIQAQSLQSTNRDLRQQLAVALTPQPTTTCLSETKLTAGTSTQQTVLTPDGERTFTVHAPTNFKNNSHSPLVLFYGGRGASAQAVESAYGMNDLPAIVVYPFPTVGKEGDFAWAGAPYSSNANDIAFTTAILDKLESELCIDETRIYAVGFSNGGGFMSKLSCEMSDRFAAYAIIAGAMYSPSGECIPTYAAPIITIHGDQDQQVPFAGSAIRRLPPIYDWTAQRASMEKCNSHPSVQNIDQFRTLSTWKDCRDHATVQHIRIHGGPHAWGNVPNDTIWRFMHQHTLR